MDNHQTYFDDEIDLREIVLSLWRGRWVIFALTLIAAVAAFSVSKWAIPKKYQASVLMAIDKPSIQFEDINNILYNSRIPASSYVQELATSISFLKNVATSSELVSQWDTEKESITEKVEVIIIGENQLRLNVKDTNPDRAAMLANAWAGLLAEKINSLYGVEVVADTLDTQVIQAHADSVHAQAVLEKALIQSEQSVFEVQLEITINDLDCVLLRSSAATRILEDLQVLEQGIKVLPDEAFLALGDALALTTLQQRSYASQICASGDQTTLLEVGNNTLVSIPVVDALSAISQLRVALQTQQTTLAEEQLRLEEIIPIMESNLVKEQYQLSQYLHIRDQTLDIYTTLLEQQTRIKNILITNARVATVSVPAIAPIEPIGPKVLMVTASAGIAGLMLGVLWIFVTGWWRSSENAVDPIVTESE